MNYRQDNVQGVDVYPDRLQGRIYPFLLSRWNVSGDNFLSFGRVYRNQVDDGFIPEAYFNGRYIGSDGNSTRGGLFFERGKVVSFFGLVEKGMKQTNGDYSAKFEYIFMIDLAVINPSGVTANNQRLDEQVCDDIETFILNNGCCMGVLEISRDIDEVLKRYSGAAKRSTLTRNMSGNNNASPSFCAIKFLLEVKYNPAVTNNQPLQASPMSTTKVFFIKDVPDTSKTILVGGNVLVYMEYAPSDTLTVRRVDNNNPYLAGLTVTYITMNNTPDTLALENGSYSTTSGTYDRTGQGAPFGLNEGDFVALSWNDLIN